MDNKKMKILIIVLAIVIIVIIVILCILLNLLKQNGYNESSFEDNKNATLEKEEKPYLIKNYNQYFSIRDNILQKYLKCIEKNDTNSVYNMLSKDYITNNNITVQNIKEKLPSYHIPKTIVQHMYMKDGNIANNIYIDAIIQNSKIGDSNNLIIDAKQEYYRIIIDINNSTFAIEPINKQIYEEAILGNDIKEEKIEKNDNNMVEYKNVNEAYVVSQYLNTYSNFLKNDVEKAYNLLEEEYKSKKFNDYSKFEKYVTSGITEGMIFKSYTKSYNEDGSINYICQDEYERKYIFKETEVFEYTVQLDDYTIENDNIIQTYTKAEAKDKGILNAQKFFQMINKQDYDSAYSILDENFKQNYFKTQADFESYIKGKLYKYNKVEYKEYIHQVTSIYGYKLEITDATGENQDIIEFNIVIKLLEGTDFVMSFAVK